MKLHEWIDVQKLGQYVSDGYISARKHPVHPLIILNYTPAAQSLPGSAWDETLSRCRGLVYEENTLDIYAIPFAKFWNYSDPSHPETLPENLPKTEPLIYEKVDGSLGIGFFYKNEFIVATRGSFESDQAKWATKWAAKNIPPKLGNDWCTYTTYLFEIVYPEDRKVVKYKYNGLVLLGGISNQTGLEYPPDLYEKFKGSSFLRGIRVANRHSYESLEHLQKKDVDNEEGYVAVWYGETTHRVKIKFDTYKRLHRMYFQTTKQVIWELVKDGKDVGQYLIGADPELINWCYNVAEDIRFKVSVYNSAAGTDFRECVQYADHTVDGHPDKTLHRKAFAFKAVDKMNPQLLFLLYDGKYDKYTEALWKLVKPDNDRFTKVEN